MMYKTKYTLARHINSEEYLKVKTKLEWKLWLQNVKSDVKAKIFSLKKGSNRIKKICSYLDIKLRETARLNPQYGHKGEHPAYL